MKPNQRGYRKITKSRRRDQNTDSPWVGKKRANETSVEDRKDAIILAAAKLFHTKGYHNTILAEIADAVTVTKPTVYYYIQSKEACLAEIMLRGQRSFLGVAETAKQINGTGLDKIRYCIRQWVVLSITDIAKCLALREYGSLSQSARNEYFGLIQKSRAQLAKFVELGIKDGSVRDIDPQAFVVVASGAMGQIATSGLPDGVSVDDFAEHLMDVFERGIAPV